MARYKLKQNGETEAYEVKLDNLPKIIEKLKLALGKDISFRIFSRPNLEIHIDNDCGSCIETMAEGEYVLFYEKGKPEFLSKDEFESRYEEILPVIKFDVINPNRHITVKKNPYELNKWIDDSNFNEIIIRD